MEKFMKKLLIVFIVLGTLFDGYMLLTYQHSEVVGAEISADYNTITYEIVTKDFQGHTISTHYEDVPINHTH